MDSLQKTYHKDNINIKKYIYQQQNNKQTKLNCKNP